MADGTPAKRSSLSVALLMAGALAASCAFGAYYFWKNSQGSGALSTAGFDLSHVDPTKPPPVSAPAAAQAASPLPIAGMSGWSPAGSPPQRALDQAAAQAGASAPPSVLNQEQAFLAQHGAEVRRYENRVLAPITSRYYRQYAVVRQVDHDFGAMPRYMQVKQQYDHDGNPFEFARNALALPEVRAEIAQRMTDPQVWKVAFGMINEALNSPPPPAVYDAAKTFMTQEPQVADYMSHEFMQNAMKNQGALIQSIGPDTDMSNITKLAHDVAPAQMGALGGVGALPAAPTIPPQQ